jgi:hypothetical protein
VLLDRYSCLSICSSVHVNVQLSVRLWYDHRPFLPQVNVDSSVREVTNQNLRQAPGPASFQLAQEQIYSLMESDSYPRFLKSLLYSQLANQRPAHAQTDCQNEKGSTKSFNGIGPTSLASQSEQKTLIWALWSWTTCLKPKTSFCPHVDAMCPLGSSTSCSYINIYRHRSMFRPLDVDRRTDLFLI